MSVYDDMIKEKELIEFIMGFGLNEIEACAIITEACYVDSSLARSIIQFNYKKREEKKEETK